MLIGVNSLKYSQKKKVAQILYLQTVMTKFNFSLMAG